MSKGYSDIQGWNYTGDVGSMFDYGGLYIGTGRRAGWAIEVVGADQDTRSDYDQQTARITLGRLPEATPSHVQVARQTCGIDDDPAAFDACTPKEQAAWIGEALVQTWGLVESDVRRARTPRKAAGIVRFFARSV